MPTFSCTMLLCVLAVAPDRGEDESLLSPGAKDRARTGGDGGEGGTVATSAVEDVQVARRRVVAVPNLAAAGADALAAVAAGSAGGATAATAQAVAAAAAVAVAAAAAGGAPSSAGRGGDEWTLTSDCRANFVDSARSVCRVPVGMSVCRRLVGSIGLPTPLRGRSA